MSRVVRTGSRDNRDAARCRFDRHADRLNVLFVIERRRFAAGSDRYDRVRALLDLIVNQSPVHIVIY